jgi:hypothetical protein
LEKSTKYKLRSTFLIINDNCGGIEGTEANLNFSLQINSGHLV